MNTSTHYTMKQFDPPPLPPPQKRRKEKKEKKKRRRRRNETVKVSPRLPSTPSNHSSLPSNVLYLQGIHNTCSKHKIIQYLRNHVWHSWHLSGRWWTHDKCTLLLWPCNLPKTQNKFILIIIWSGDNKTQRNTARECIHVHRHTSREEERCITMLLEKSDKPCTEWIFRYVL